MFTIGEFSKASGLTVKTLRFYHAEGLLVPAYVDPDTGYRYYRPEQVEAARVISRLRACVKDRGYEIECPTREVYLKGPGLIFRGNPQKYLTEIQLLVNESLRS